MDTEYHMYQWIFDYATYCCSTSHRYSISLRSGSCGVHLHTLKLISCSRNIIELNEFWCIILLKVAIRGCDHKGMDNPEQQYSVCLNDTQLGRLNTSFLPIQGLNITSPPPKPLVQGTMDPGFHVVWSKLWPHPP